MDENTKKQLHLNYDTVSRVRKTQARNLLDAGVASVIHALSTQKQDDAKFLGILRDTDTISKYLTSKPPQSKLLKEVIKAYNFAGSNEERLKAYSMVCTEFSYPILAKYNRKKESGSLETETAGELKLI